MMPEASVIVLNYNRAELTAGAVESLLAQKAVKPEVIVIDNGSTDGSPEKIAKRFQNQITLVRNSENRGFSPACNQGFALAKSKWVALMNNDAVADEWWLRNSLSRAGTGDKIGVVIPKIVNHFDRQKLDGIGVGFWLDGLSRARHRGEPDGAGWDGDSPQIFSGCACLLRRQMVEELGGFDPGFFAYSEDSDLGIRSYLSGWQSVFAPEAVVYHRYSGTSAGQAGYSPLKLYYVERNRIRILLRYYPWRLVLLSPFTSLCRYAYLAGQVVLGRGKGPGLGAWSGLRALSRAVFDAMVSLPEQVRLRKKWRASKEARLALERLIRGNYIPLKTIARLD